MFRSNHDFVCWMRPFWRGETWMKSKSCKFTPLIGWDRWEREATHTHTYKHRIKMTAPSVTRKFLTHFPGHMIRTTWNEDPRIPVQKPSVRTAEAPVHGSELVQRPGVPAHGALPILHPAAASGCYLASASRMRLSAILVATSFLIGCLFTSLQQICSNPKFIGKCFIYISLKICFIY